MADILNETTDFLTKAKSVGDALVSFAGSVGIGGLRLDIIQNEEVQLSTNITTHYTENNTPIQDDIVIQPVRFVLRGDIGEIVDRMKKKEGFLDKATRQFSTCLSYVPSITQTATLVGGAIKDPKSAFGSLTNTIKTGSSLFDLYNSINLPTDNQSSAFLYFESLINAKQTVTVKTPWRTYPTMAIKSVRVIQGDETTDISTFIIAVQEIRTIKTSTIEKVGASAEKALSAMSKNNGLLGKIATSVKESAFGKWIVG